MRTVNLYREYLAALERVDGVGDLVSASQLRSLAQPFLERRWIVKEGYLTHIEVPYLDFEFLEEVEVTVNEEAGIYSYPSPSLRKREITGPLADITVYAFNSEVWLDDLAGLFAFEAGRLARQRTLVGSHLWHLGNLQVARSRHFAPIYVGRCLSRCIPECHQALLDRIRPSQGIVLTSGHCGIELPNDHQTRALDEIFINDVGRTACDFEALDRLLRGLPTDGVTPSEYFDEKTGTLLLAHMEQPKVFKGFQEKVIALLWKERRVPGLKWSDIKGRTNCSKDIDSVFGKGVWREWIDQVGHGHYRLRVSNAVN